MPHTRDMWYVGVIISIFASFAGVLGNQSIRMAHLRESKHCVDPLRILGLFLIVVVNTGGHLTAMAFASQTLLAPLAALTIVINTITDPFFLNEPMTKRDYIATVVTFSGATLVAYFGPHTNHEIGSKELFHYYTAPGFKLYLYISAGLLVVMLVAIASRARFPRAAKLALPMFAGFVGGLSGVLAKSTVDLIQAATKGGTTFEKPFSYAIFVGAGACAITQLKLLDASLARYPAMYVVPVYQAILTINGTVSSAVYFKDLRGMSLVHMIFFASGAFVALMGTIIITARPEDDEASSGLDEVVPSPKGGQAFFPEEGGSAREGLLDETIDEGHLQGVVDVLDPEPAKIVSINDE